MPAGCLLRQPLGEAVTGTVHKGKRQDGLAGLERVRGEVRIQLPQEAEGLARACPAGESLRAHGANRTTFTVGVDRAASGVICA